MLLAWEYCSTIFLLEFLNTFKCCIGIFPLSCFQPLCYHHEVRRNTHFYIFSIFRIKLFHSIHRRKPFIVRIVWFRIDPHQCTLINHIGNIHSFIHFDQFFVILRLLKRFFSTCFSDLFKKFIPIVFCTEEICKFCILSIFRQSELKCNFLMSYFDHRHILIKFRFQYHS